MGRDPSAAMFVNPCLATAAIVALGLGHGRPSRRWPLAVTAKASTGCQWGDVSPPQPRGRCLGLRSSATTTVATFRRRDPKIIHGRNHVDDLATSATGTTSAASATAAAAAKLGPRGHDLAGTAATRAAFGAGRPRPWA